MKKGGYEVISHAHYFVCLSFAVMHASHHKLIKLIKLNKKHLCGVLPYALKRLMLLV